MTMRLDHILTEKGEVDMRLKRFVACVDAAGGRDQDGIAFGGNCETWAVRQKAAMPCSLAFWTECLTTHFLGRLGEKPL